MYMFLYNKIVWPNIILELYLSFLGGMELVAIYTPPNKYSMIYLILEFCVVLQIMFGPSEYVKEISGHGHKANTSYLCQLKIVTNYAEYGPFGDWTGIPFRFTVQRMRPWWASLEAMTHLSSQRLVLTSSLKNFASIRPCSSLQLPACSFQSSECLISSRFHCSSNKMAS